MPVGEATLSRDAVEIRAGRELTVRTVRSLCRSIEAELAGSAREIGLNLDAVKTCDVVGISAVMQAPDIATRHGVRLAIQPSPALHAALVDAEVLDDLALGTPSPESARVVRVSDDAAGSARMFPLEASRVRLRPPTWEELPLFERWANDAFMDQMVGSTLLYRCRAVGAYHADVTAALLGCPTSVVLLIEPHGEAPIGFVRLYSIHLAQRYAFLETAVSSPASLRKGWGIEASRLLLAWACDVLRLERVEAKVFAYNVLSANALVRNGFRREGVLRQARVYGGERWDIEVFSILEPEMRAQRASERFPAMGLWTRPC